MNATPWGEREIVRMGVDLTMYRTKKSQLDELAFSIWWRGTDSNHRRRSRQIYSLLPLATREPLQGVLYLKNVFPTHLSSAERIIANSLRL